MDVLSDEELVKKVWTAYGEKDPYYSVMTKDIYHIDQYEENKTAFWEMGRKEANIVKDIYEEYHTHTKVEKPRVLDYGCGVGRLMMSWGAGCEGCDISPTHLGIAKEKLGEEHPLHLVEPGECPKGYDVIYSLLTLQHNRPSLMKKCIKSIVEALNDDGLAMLHAPYYMEKVYPSVETMEMYYLPKDEFVKTVEEAGASVIAYNEKYDLCGDNIKNCIYIVSKSQKSIFKRLLNHKEPQHWTDIHPSGDFTRETKDLPE
jgi:SAM-dependent methyltransferase